MFEANVRNVLSHTREPGPSDFQDTLHRQDRASRSQHKRFRNSPKNKKKLSCSVSFAGEQGRPDVRNARHGQVDQKNSETLLKKHKNSPGYIRKCRIQVYHTHFYEGKIYYDGPNVMLINLWALSWTLWVHEVLLSGTVVEILNVRIFFFLTQHEG